MSIRLPSPRSTVAPTRRTLLRRGDVTGRARYWRANDHGVAHESLQLPRFLTQSSTPYGVRNVQLPEGRWVTQLQRLISD